MSLITVDKENTTKVNLYFEDHGKGRPVVLIHGFPMSGVAWEKEVAALLDAGHRVITYDRRGFGKSSQPTFGYDYDTFASDLDKLMTELDLRDAVLVGHSMGTGEITRYLGTYGSQRVVGAVLISPIPPFLLQTNDNPEGVDKSVFEDIMSRIAEDRPAYITKFFSDFYNLDETLDKLVSREVVQANWNVGVNASSTGTFNCVSAWLTDFRKDLPKIDVPVLIIQGDADRILPFQVTGERLHKELKGSKLIVLKNAPHGIPWTHATEINRELVKFLADLGQLQNRAMASGGYA